ncbi:MAG: hypothetical protein ACJ71G_09425, partial [Nitrososphaeraceae archaeon]
SDEYTTNVSATFSCEICNGKFNSREELKQHTIQEHTDYTSEGYNKSLRRTVLAAFFIMFE